MKASNENAPNRRRRRWRCALIGVPSLLVLAVLALPWVLGTRTARTWLVERANRRLAPAKLEVASWNCSWIGSTRIKGLVLRDAQGDAVVTAPGANWDRNLFQILFTRPELGTLRLDRASIDAERSPDGAIDLYEALRPVLGRDPRTAIQIEVPDGRLRFRAPGVIEPVVAETATVSLTVTATPGPISWRARLAKQIRGSEPGKSSLEVEGLFHRGPHDGGPDLKFSAKGKDWPWAIGDGNARAAGSLGGTVEVSRQFGHLMLDGKATLGRVEVSGAWLNGDVLRMDTMQGDWSIEMNECAVAVKRLFLKSPLATLQAETPARIVGRVELAAIAAQLPRALRLRKGVTLDQGTADILVKTDDQGAACGMLVDLSARLSDIRAHDGARSIVLRDPATLRAGVRRLQGKLTVESLSAETPYLQGAGRGGLTGGVAFTGSLDLAKLQNQLRELVDFGNVAFAGQGKLKGGYNADKARFRADLNADFRGLTLAGFGPIAVAREAANASVIVEGPAGSGIPLGWKSLASTWTAGALSARIQADSDGPSLAVEVAGPVLLGDVPARAEGKIKTRGDARGFTIDPLVVTIRPTGKDDPRPPITLTSTGRYTRTDGVLTLARVGDEPNPVVAIDREGVWISGLGGPGGFRLDGGFSGEISALAPWVSSAPEGLRGRWTARGSGRSAPEGWELGARLDMTGLSWGKTDPGGDATKEEAEPLVLAVRALLPNDGKAIELPELSLSSKFGTVEAAGRVDDPGGTPIADLKGRVSPHWETVTAWLGSHVEPGARVRGRPRSFHVHVPIGKDWRRGLEGDVGVSISSADVYGMKLGATTIALRSKNGETTIDPIVTTLNGGSLRVCPSIRVGEGVSDVALVLGRGSSLRDSTINDEVSRRVLSYVAPMMNNATRVNGRVSAEVVQAVIPLRPGAGKSAVVKGEVVFQDVEFSPSGIFRDLLGRIGAEDVTLIRINKPVSLEIADRRVYQRGLVIPIGKLSQIEMDGWVGFDRDLNVVVGIPVLPTALAETPVIGGIAARSRLRIPVRGTLDRPEIDSEAFKAGMVDLKNSVLAEGIPAGIFELFKRFSRPRAPNAAPTLPRTTPQERREKQQEKRANRRLRRGSQE